MEYIEFKGSGYVLCIKKKYGTRTAILAEVDDAKVQNIRIAPLGHAGSGLVNRISDAQLIRLLSF